MELVRELLIIINLNGKFGKNVELTVSGEGKKEFKEFIKNINLKNIENGNKKSD
jgi:hypothetical protein